ncbi:MAG: GNAT family N-acetyltransferase [candidate division Zixibacteria bacterium]|nr:GNAT family N-acetyltransferase [candidate division Zixibacteria bacterium]MBU1472037.1 GNAT family N-acetyltransferase [candidate division Zixibacteria bacterium]MBU2626345.1 GNAT family N-acetyltransferase [candidate division Zixibacteria bacterium]
MDTHDIRFEPITRHNWEDVLRLEVLPEQRHFVPSPTESLAAAYVKPWDEALDPYAIYKDQQLIGCFYISYTPESSDNYWIGGLLIDHKFQGRGHGRTVLREILQFVPTLHPNCEKINLTVEKDNLVAQRLYGSLGFGDTGKVNKYGETILAIPLRRCR